MYAKYIDASVSLLDGRASEKTIAAILKVADELRQTSRAFQNSDTDEVNYIEACLWLCLEAIIKLISAYLGSFGGEILAELSQAVAGLGFEYGRLMLYQKEQALLTAYLENQRVLDERLQQEYDAYITEVQRNAACFNELIHQAFDADFKEKLKLSATFALAVGVLKTEILKNNTDIDAFFLA